MALWHSSQCPFGEKYVPLIQEIEKQSAIQIALHKIETAEQAQSAPAPFTTYSLFYNGQFITNEILSEKKFRQLLETMPISC